MKQLYKRGGGTLIALLMTAVLAVGCSSDDEDDSTKQTYSVTVASGIEHGTVTANPTSAEAGATITLTATPASGYELDSYSVTDSDSKSIAVSGNSFTMPESNVTVNATFKTQGTESGGGSGGTDAIHISHLNEISGSGNYILDNDIQDERFGSLTNATVSLNLNGHTINSLNDLSINGGTVSLRGNGKIYCKGQMLSYGDGLSEERKHNGFGINNAAVLNIYDNVVIENADSGVFVFSGSGCTINMYGGSITKCDYGVFMYGDDTTSAVNMHGGTITGCRKGVFAYGQAASRVNIDGGTVTGNTKDID